MGLDASEIGVRIWKYTIVTTKICYKTVCNHPFLVGILCFLILLQRSFPLLFSLLVSVSPVLVCTAVLLGTLLSFGQPNIPEIEKEEKKTHDEISALKSVVLGDTVVVQRDESFGVENAISEEFRISKVEKNDSSDDDETPLVGGNSLGIQFEKRENEEAEEGVYNSELEHEEVRNDSGFDDGEAVVFGNQYSMLHNGEEYERFESIYTEGTGDPLDSVPDSSWKQMADDGDGDNKDNDDDDDDSNDDDDESSSDSESDGAESSSPDASMTDILPMLDELHPLLDLEAEAPQPAHMSHDDESDATSEHSHGSKDSGGKSGEDRGNQEEDDDEEEGVQGDKQDGIKSAITWTEDDQKNLINLGTSEMERNQRLENLIARRRARKSLRLVAEKNLIDFESTDLAFTMPPISTSRGNPFDFPSESYDGSLGLPPIPGSAPSVLRRNPFDIPYESNEEKPNLTGDSFQEEFMTSHQKDTFFRRHESFSLGPSMLGGFKHERQDNKWRPFFVPERLAYEGTSYPSFQRQSSGFSDSKASSAPETESMGSAADEEEKNLVEHDDIAQETEQIFVVNQTLDHVESGSQSPGEVGSGVIEQIERRYVGEHDEAEIKMEDFGNHQETETNLAATGGMGDDEEFNRSEIHATKETDEEESDQSSSSSSSVEDEEIAVVENNPRGDLTGEVGTSIHSSLEESNLNFANAVVDDNQTKDPVYDSSPQSMEKHPSFSSVSSDLQVEVSEIGSPPMSGQSNKVSDVHNESMENVASTHEVMQAGSSVIQEEDEAELRSSGGTVVSEQNANESIVPEYVVEEVTTDSSSSSSDAGSVEGNMMYEDESLQHEQDHSHSMTIDREIITDVSENWVSESSSYQYMPEDSAFSAVEEQQPALVVEHVSVDHPEISSSESESQEDISEDKNQILQVKHNEVQSSSPDANIDVAVHQDREEMQDFTGPSYHYEPSDVQSGPSSDDHEERQEPSVAEAVSVEKVNVTDNVNIPEAHDPESKFIPHLSHLSPDPTFIPSEDLKGNSFFDETENEDRSHVLEANFTERAFEPHVSDDNMSEETDEIKDIEEDLLSELDAVGDFSVRAMGSNLNEVEKHSVGDGEDLHVVHGQDENDKHIVVESVAVDPMPAAAEGSQQDPELAESNLELPVLNARSFEDIDMGFKQIHEGVDVEDVILPSSIDDKAPVLVESKDPVEADVHMQVVEATSVEDIHTALKEVSKDNLHKQPVPSDSEDGSVEVEAGKVGSSHETASGPEVSHVQETGTSSSESPVETDVHVQVVEATSVEDIHTSLKEVSEDNLHKQSVPSDSEDGSVEVEAGKVGSSQEIASGPEVSHVRETGTSPSESPVETDVHLQEVEAISLEDIHTASKEVSEDTLHKQPVPSDSEDDDGSVVEAGRVVSSQDIASAPEEYHVQETGTSASESPVETGAHLQVVEATALEDIHTALKEVSEDTLHKQPVPSSSEDGSVVEAGRVGSSQEIASGPKESHVQETGTISNESPHHEVDRTSKDSHSTKKAKSHKSSSSSSSSSSDSD